MEGVEGTECAPGMMSVREEGKMYMKERKK